MAEAVGLAGSIVGLVQVSTHLYFAACKFYREAKEAKSKISALALQTRNLSAVLQSLSLLASSPLFDDEAGTSIPDFRDTYIESCSSTLYRIKRKLEKAERDFDSGSHRKLITRSLKWPFSSQETHDLTAELSRHGEVLQLALSADTMSHLLQCLANTSNIAKSVAVLDNKLDRKEKIDKRAELTAKREKVMHFFLKVNPEDYFQDCRTRRQPNTGKWLIERDQTFQNWMSSPGSQIWLSGIPGAGKTILCGAVIDEILQEQTPSTAVAFFFCDYKYPESQNPVNILAALAVQLATQADAAFEVLESYHEELHPHNRIGKPSEIKGMIQVVQKMVAHYDLVYLVVDGIDECGSNVVEVLQSLKQLTRGSQVNLALFSRNEPDIIEELSESPRIEIAAHTEDLELYVLAQMESRKRLGGLAIKNPELHEHIRRTLIEGANGMFRWVACQLDHLDGLPSDGRRRKALTELPPTLFETYDRILDRIVQEDEHDQELCRKALHWIGLGYKNMNPLALCEAISIPDDHDIVDKELLVEPDWIARRCSSLIRMGGEESDHPHFQFAHFTVKEYLRGIKPQSTRGFFRFSEDAALRHLVGTSLRFLTFSLFDRRPTIASSEIQRMAERNEQHPFYPVAAVNVSRSSSTDWEDEVSKQLSLLLEDEAMMSYARILFHPDKNGMFLSWVLQATWYEWEDPSDVETFCNIIGLLLMPEFSTLHIAAMLALPSICTHLIDVAKVDVNVCCRVGTPLHALFAGVELLYPMDDFTYDAALHFRISTKPGLVAYDQPRRCLEIFLENGADTSLRWDTTSIFQMAINNSVRRNHDKTWIYPLINSSTVVTDDCIEDFRRKLFSGAIDISILDAIFKLGSDSDTAPGWARLASLIQTWRMESEQDTEVGSGSLALQVKVSDEDFADGIRISLSQNLTDTLATLVQDSRFRPDMYIPYDGKEAMPVLHLAIQRGSLKSVEMLLEAGCDAKLVDNDGWTSLHQCALSDIDDAPITTLMIESGAVGSVRNNLGKTCWHLAAQEGNVSVLKVLIEKDCDSRRSLATTSNTGRTPLASAILEGEADSALLLLEQCHGDRDYFQSDQSLLDEAAASGSEDLFLRLHEKFKEAEVTDAINSSRPFDHINMLCSPKLLDYLRSSWVLESNAGYNSLVNYLLDANNLYFKDPHKYPTRYYMDHVIRGLLPPDHFFVDNDKRRIHCWEVFCQKVVPHLTKNCNHRESSCRTHLISIIFEILIANDVLASYERTVRLPSYRLFFRGLLGRKHQLRCSWIASSVRQVIAATSLSGDLPREAMATELLSDAVRTSSIELVRELLDHGVDVHAAHGLLSPLEEACRNADMPIFHLVFQYLDRKCINRTGSQGMTLLHWGVCGRVSGYLAKIEKLLQLGANIDSMTDDPQADTALTLASRSYRQDVIALLVSRGADSLHRARDGWTILQAASITGDFRYIQHLVHSDVPDSFWFGVRDMHMPSFNITVEKSAAIHFAAYNGNAHFLARLIESQVPFDANAVTGYPNFTPLHFASNLRHLEVVELLISSNADVNLKDAYGRRPIDMAANMQHSDIIKILLESGSEKPSSQFIEGGTGDSGLLPRVAFETAIVKGQLNFCREMARQGQSINAELASCSCTPIVCAVAEGHDHIVDWLASAGVELPSVTCKSIHPSLRCIASLGAHNIRSSNSFAAILGLALGQNMGWYGSILGPLHVAILDNWMGALETILSHIRMNEHAYRKTIETEMISRPADTKWGQRSALSILVNEFNQEEAFSGRHPWEKMRATGSPLHWAIYEDNVDAVKLLLENEADVNLVDSSGKTPLHLAAWHGSSPEILTELLNAGAGPGGRLNAILEATREGDLELLKILAEADPETLRAADRFTSNGLMYLPDSVPVFQYLLAQGLSLFNHEHFVFSAVTINTTVSRSNAFIFNSGLLSQCTEELMADAFAYALDVGRYTVIKWLYRSVWNHLFPALLNVTRSGWASPLCVAAARHGVDQVQDLIDMGAEIDLEGCSYGSPLMVACILGNLDVTRRLVRLGASLFYVSQDGLPRSAVALSSRHQEVKRWLLVDRHIEQPKLEYQPSQSTPKQQAWSGPRLFRLALPEYMHRNSDESQWSHLQRLQKWKGGLLGSTLAETRRNSGLDFEADLEAESRKTQAQAAHRQFLARLGEE